MNLVIKAIQFAGEKHKGQERKVSGLPYILHPVTVMELVQIFKGDSKNIENLKCAALLHDTLEDCECSYMELEREFNPMVASIVMELTSDSKATKDLGKNEYLKWKMSNMSKYALTLKLLDRLSNVMDNPKKKYLEDTKELIEFLDNVRELNSTQKQIVEFIKTYL